MTTTTCPLRAPREIHSRRSRPYARKHSPAGRPGGAPLRPVRRLAVGFLSFALLACGELPRDPEDSLDRARGGTLHVGVSAAAPWIIETSAAPDGSEAEIVRSFGRTIDARVEWVWGGTEENLTRLERGELDVVAAGLTMRSPWSGRVALTRPHVVIRGSAGGGEERHVLATAPGENALLVALERHIRSRR